MDWKEFFKPNVKKIAIVVLLGILTVVSFLSIMVIPGRDYVDDLDNLPLKVLQTPAYLYCLYANTDYGPRLVCDSTIYNAIVLVYWYILSCAVLWVYENKVEDKERVWKKIKMILMVIGAAVIILLSLFWLGQDRRPIQQQYCEGRKSAWCGSVVSGSTPTKSWEEFAPGCIEYGILEPTGEECEDVI